MKSSNEQVQTSSTRLEEQVSASTDKITEVRIRADQREIKRKNGESIDKAKISELIQKSNDQTKAGEATVDFGWKECLAATNAQDLCKLLDEQKRRCDEAVTVLEEIGSQLCSQLREQDHEYVTALRRNRKDIEYLQQTIVSEHKALKAAFDEELRLVETAFKNDQKLLLKTQQNELEKLMSDRDNAEIQGLEQQRDDIDKKRQEIKSCQNDRNNESITMKETYETELRRIEIALEDTRARHELDTDKLEYDVRVLTDLAEDETAVKKQKRRIMKGKGELYDSLDAKSRAKKIEVKENKRLERDCERIERQAMGLREKFERFKSLDEEKYRAVLALHKEDLAKLQAELNESQELIFGKAIGCSKTTESSQDSKVTSVENESKLEDTDEPKSKAKPKAKVENADEFGLECDKDNVSDRSDEWHQAESLMTKYRSVLQKREELNAQAHSLNEHNKELQKDLSSLLKDKVNEELTFPPEVEDPNSV